MIKKYYPVDSLVHKMNSLAKIICFLLFIFMIFLTSNFKHNLILSILLILMLFNTKIPLSIYFKTVFNVKWLILLLLIINIIVGSSLEVIIIILRLIYVVLYAAVLMLTTPMSAITYGLEKLLAPLLVIRIPVNKISLFVRLALSFIPIFIEKGNIIAKSQASRGIDYYNSNLYGKILAVKLSLIPNLFLSINKIISVSSMMKVKLYGVNKKRTNFRQNKWTFYDTFIVIIHICLFILIVKEVFL